MSSSALFGSKKDGKEPDEETPMLPPSFSGVDDSLISSSDDDDDLGRRDDPLSVSKHARAANYAADLFFLEPSNAAPLLDVSLEEEKHGEEETDAAVAPTKPVRRTSTSRKSVNQSLYNRPLVKEQESFFMDVMEFREGSVPQSLIIALVIGTVCGAAAYVYYAMLFGLLEFLWHTLPEKTVAVWLPEWLHWVWIPLVGFIMSILTGLSVVIMGEPGDLAYTIKCVHDKAYISMDHVMPMVAASQFSILGGGSLGPEAPLVAICAALGGFLSRRLFGQRNRNVVRKHTLMGMAGALSAFFGCPLGGSLFALEVNSRFGVEYFEHMVESIFCGEVCLVVFRSLSGLAIGPIWDITPEKLTGAEPKDVMIGAVIGLLGAFVAYMFTKFHGTVMFWMASFNLLDNKFAVKRALVGGVVIVTLGLLIPQTMFWGEAEFGSIATLSSASTLEHVWPTTGLLGFELTSAGGAFLMGFAKMVAISFTVAGGYRGGFIFPFFAAGAAFGRALCFIIPGLNIQVSCLCMAAGINVAITRTSLATSLILCYLAGEPNAISAVLASSLVSLFATTYMPFIKTQKARNDIDNSIFDIEERASRLSFAGI